MKAHQSVVGGATLGLTWPLCTSRKDITQHTQAEYKRLRAYLFLAPSPDQKDAPFLEERSTYTHCGTYHLSQSDPTYQEYSRAILPTDSSFRSGYPKRRLWYFIRRGWSTIWSQSFQTNGLLSTRAYIYGHDGFSLPLLMTPFEILYSPPHHVPD